eukprot:scaffold60324_cov34-Cyclotella_meneghiniana.AAC.1
MMQILRHKYTEELAEYSKKYGSKFNPVKEMKMDEDQSMRRPSTCKPFLSELAQKESIVKYFVKAFDEAMAFNFGDDLDATLLECIKKTESNAECLQEQVSVYMNAMDKVDLTAFDMKFLNSFTHIYYTRTSRGGKNASGGYNWKLFGDLSFEAASSGDVAKVPLHQVGMMVVKTENESLNHKVLLIHDDRIERERQVKHGLTKVLFLCFLKHKYAQNLKQLTTNTLARFGSDLSALNFHLEVIRRCKVSELVLASQQNLEIESLAKAESERKISQTLALARFNENLDEAEESAPFVLNLPCKPAMTRDELISKQQEIRRIASITAGNHDITKKIKFPTLKSQITEFFGDKIDTSQLDQLIDESKVLPPKKPATKTKKSNAEPVSVRQSKRSKAAVSYLHDEEDELD